ncbi:PTS glucose transporter subunit IIA [Virgibacillus sp. MSJ-26]|uniref:PTS sugar transporter subunit IIA n=1 Tax=Virgibacillus sp. MSJ-26 TaxID=2841522 RepID=UPI001C0FA90A|nr:PTS glucose transporter subunit IIA [Virgibacillus sp. MSJ-26]MBU5468641.1 PTS glucose transporter subunit IIA [Virgibacillus sp. MSJ-26]
MLKNLFKKSSEKEKLEIYAPLNGKVVKLEDVPDPVFNQKMMGEGIAIMPSEGKVVSPVEGKIVQVPESKHAVGIEATDGTEILIHVGLETVALKGEGFTVNVAAGDKVSVGNQLMKFNLDYIKEHASDSVTPIVITNSGDSDKDFVMTEENDAVAGETVLITASAK